MTTDSGIQEPNASTVPPTVPRVFHALKMPIVMVGFGSIGRGTLPLLERHFKFDKSQVHVIDPDDKRFAELRGRGYANLHHLGLTRDNYIQVLTSIYGQPKPEEQDGKYKDGDGVDGSFRGVLINVSVDTSTVDIMTACRALGVFYLDTVVEPWKGFYFDTNAGHAARTNYAMREEVIELKHNSSPNSITSITCCGANPGMVSFLLKEALIKLAKDTNTALSREPETREEWAALMQRLGVKGVHIAERDTQVAKTPKPPNTFCCTWSAEGFLSEGNQPAELGWGTHEKWFPPNGHRHDSGCGAAIYMDQPGANTRIRSWCPTLGAQYGFLVTHNESISIADYFTVRKQKGGKVTSDDGHTGGDILFRPTVHYAYHPCPDAVLSLHESFGHDRTIQPVLKVYTEDEIASGFDELGVLLYGHSKNALWYGSTLSHEQAIALAPDQNATGLQVTSAIVAGLVWALENPHKGVTEADELDYKRCLDIQRPYLGKLHGVYTDWTPLNGLLKTATNQCLFEPPKRTNVEDPWQFSNVLV